MPAARATQAVIRNAIEAAKATGLDVAAVRVTRDGEVWVIVNRDDLGIASPEGDKSCDEIFAGRA